MSALEGVRVVALEQSVSLPYCTQALAALGAEVIKIERPPDGDVVRGWDDVVRGLSTGFVAFNVGKRDLSLDLGLEEGREVLRRLVATADVFVENLVPGAAARLGAGHEELRAQNPRLVYCSVSGYGQDGPWRDVKAYDLLVQAESGLLLSNGTPDAPAKIGTPAADLIAGTHAALGIVAALLERGRTGEGAYLDVSMLESAAAWLSYYPHRFWHAGTEPPRTGMRHQFLTPYGPFLAADDRYVVVVVASDRDWARFCEAIERPEWIEDERVATVAARSARREEVDALVEAEIATRPSDEWLDRLAAVGLPFGRVRTIAEVVEHPQLVARGAIGEVDSPVGALPWIRSPLGDPERPRVPGFGEDTDALLAELGYDDAAIAALHGKGVV
jgi:itaconate CoA-transferase